MLLLLFQLIISGSLCFLVFWGKGYVYSRTRVIEAFFLVLRVDNGRVSVFSCLFPTPGARYRLECEWVIPSFPCASSSSTIRFLTVEVSTSVCISFKFMLKTCFVCSSYGRSSVALQNFRPFWILEKTQSWRAAIYRFLLRRRLKNG